MGRISRVVVPGYPHHVTQRGVRSIPIFDRDDDRKAYLAVMGEQLSRFGIDVLAWCLMTNHTHLVVVPKDPLSLARAIGEAHRRYTRRKNFAEDVRGYLFQGRFNSCVLDERHLLAAARYVELNPVQAKMVESAEDYQWSSARFHLGLNKSDPLVKDKSLLGLVEDWAGYLNRNEDGGEKTLLKSIRTGRPAGGEEFLQRIEVMIQRRLTLGKAGRPKKKS
jgi:putative transposase